LKTEIELHSRESEMSILGGLLMDNNSIDRMGELEESAFFSESHRLIYRAIKKLSATSKTWDVLTVADLLESVKRLQTVGGLVYLSNIVQATPSAANIKHYADIVRQHHVRRKILTASAELSEIISNRGDIAVALDKAQSSLLSITEGVATDEPISIAAVMQTHINTLDQRITTGENTITTGLEEVNEILNGGWRRGQLIVLAARTGMGKSAFSLHNSIHAAINGFGVLYLSMEMVAGELADRAIASLGDVSLNNLITAKLTSQDWDGVTVATSKLYELPFFILDKSGLNFWQVAMLARRHKRKHGLDVLVIDYLQLMAGADDEKRHAQIEEITRNLKSLAKELDVAIILLSQLSRKTEEARRPKLSHLRDSGSIEQDADVVIFIHREEMDNPETEWKDYADIYIAKQRQGRLGKVGVKYIGSQVRFEKYNGATPDWDNQKNKKERFEYK